MEQSINSLYTGPLSRDAQKVLAVLRAQSLRGATYNQNYSSNHRQSQSVQRDNCSQGESWAESSWSQVDRSERYAYQPQVSSLSTSHHNSSSQKQSSQTLAIHQYSQIPDSSLSSQASCSSSSCWDFSLQMQTEAYYQYSQTYSHRKCFEPPAYKSSQSLSFSQHEVPETAETFCHRDRYTLSLQVPERISEHQATPGRNSTKEIRPSFIFNIFPDEEDPDVLFPTTEQPNSHKEAPAVVCHPVSPYLKICEGRDNNTSGSQREKAGKESWHVARKELQDTPAPGSRLKWKQPLSDPTEAGASGAEDGGMLYQQSEPESIKNGRAHLPPSDVIRRQENGCDAHSPKLMRNIVGEEDMLIADSEHITDLGTRQISNIGHETQNVVNEATRKARGNQDMSVLHGKGSASEMEQTLPLKTSEDAAVKRHLNSLDLTDNTVDSGTRGETCGEDKENYLKYRVSTSEVKEAEHSCESENKATTAENPQKSPIFLESGQQEVSHCSAENPQDKGQTETDTAENDHTQELLGQSEASSLGLDDNSDENLEKTDVLEVRMEVKTENRTRADPDHQMEVGQCKTNDGEVNEFPRIDTKEWKSREAREAQEVPPVDSDVKNKSAENTEGGRGATPTLFLVCGANGSGIRAARLSSSQQQHDNAQTTNGSTRGSSSSLALAPTRTVALGLKSSVQELTSTASPIVVPKKELENRNLKSSPSHHCLKLSFSLKRKHEAFQHQTPNPAAKISLTRHPPKWEPPRSSQQKPREGRVSEWKSARELRGTASPSHETRLLSGARRELDASKQTQQNWQSKIEELSRESPGKASKNTPFCKPCKLKWATCETKHVTSGPKSFSEAVNTSEPPTHSRAGCLTASLTSDSRVKDAGKLNPDEKVQMFEMAVQAKVVVLTMVYQDGSTQLDPEQKLTPPVCGLLILMKNEPNCSMLEGSLGPNDTLVYLKLEHTPAWAQQQVHQSHELFTRDMLLQLLSRSQLVVCYKAKDLLRTVLQFYRRDLSWKQVAGCHIQDPQVSGWLLDPTDPSSCYQDLLNKHCKRPHLTPALGAQKVSQVISGLYWLYRLNMKLCSELHSQGLWQLYSDMELNMIPVLAAMESHRIHVDKEALRRTSDLLGTKMKQLEQEAHRAAGQIFLLTSNTQLRTVLFEKLRLHERCENKKLPKTTGKQQQSTSEAALLQLQDLHPLPKIILEYRQVHKIKSTFVDGILSCMMNKNHISSTWHQTSVVTGRISAKHPNFQALPRQPLQITKKQYIRGKEEEVVTVHPRAMFIPQEGCTFLAADFCQVELRLLAHLSSDPELLRIFTNPQADVFTMLASQWKGMSENEVTSEDREHAKRIVYSVIYGAGRERLSGILGVSSEQASRFQDRFLQTYRDVQAFIQKTIQQSHKKGYVLSIMGRRRTLPNINSPDWGVRMQAERQAVNFVVQGSAADLCKMAMIRIFNLVSSSSSLSARLVAQLHDELLYEVEDSQVQQFAALVRSAMESLQHIDHLGVHLKVPLKVAVSSGKSWGSMSELTVPLIPAP
ncbi:DNA polymerase nu isoform X2 [Archocentrus centrarchus]|uniref:DNA polymerase nu isoform X2 n=1 Tax=Archocentrus centrarchus TaxID=63155 RepID=UPI0011E9DFD7|nr:DNA polymerase nu isoform X2 [Archocentrus centrarchus]